MAVCNDGKIKTWGTILNSKGVDTVVTTPRNVSIPPDLTFSQADAGSGYHVVAIDCKGKVWAFGRNDNGQLGIPPSTGSSTPVPVTGIGGQGQLSDVLYVSGANRASYAILSDGRLVAWGENTGGQLGRGTTTGSSSIPNYVLRANNIPLTNIIQVDAGDATGYALDADGYVWAWGDNLNGALGRTGATSGYAQRVQKSDGTPLTNIIIISGGDRHALALDADGTVWSWGGNWGNGQLGNGTTADQPYAAHVVGVGGTGLLTGASYISAGQASSMVVTKDNKVVTFGSNSLFLANNQKAAVGGNLGQNTTAPNLTPATLSLTPHYVLDCQGNQLSNIAYVSDADAVTYAISLTGDVYVMGGNTNGELGLGNSTAVGCATKLDLAVTYSCGLPDQCPTPNLGPDIPVCSTTDLSNITLFTPNFRTYKYTWYYRANSSTSFNPVTAAADTNILKPTLLGQYMVKVERTSNNCTTCKPGYDTVTVDQSGTNSTFCTLTNNTLNFSVTGNGTYRWFKSATGTDSLPPLGNTHSIDINQLVPQVSGEDSVYSLYVEDLKPYTGTVGPLQASSVGSSNPYPRQPNDSQSQLIFNVYNNLTLNAVWLKFFNYNGAGNYVVTLQILDGQGNPVTSVTNTLAVPAGGNNNLVTNAIRFPLGAGISLTPGTGYVLKLTGAGGLQLAIYNPSNFNFPITSGGDISNRISITGVNTSTTDAKVYPSILNWEIFSTGGGYPCGRLKVSLTKSCPCAAPKINVASSTNAFSFCDNGTPSSLNLTVNAVPTTPPFTPFNYRYQWYKNGTLITPGGDQNTIPVSSTTGIAEYSIRVGHTSVNKTRCYSDTTFNITLQKPIANNVILGVDTICPGFPAKQINGVGTVTGGLGTTTYQWVSSTTNAAPWTNVASNGNLPTYSPGVLTQTTYFRRVVTNKGVCPIDTSNVAWVFALPAITPGSVTASANTICENTSVSISTTPATGGIKPYKYVWASSTNGAAPSTIPNETSENLVNAILTLTQTTTITRTVTSSNGGCPAPASVTITVDKKVIGNTITDSLKQQLCDGQTAQTIVEGVPGDNGKSPTYQWLSSSNVASGFTVIPNATGKDLSPGIVHTTTYYKRIVTSSGVCKNDTSVGVVKILVDPNVTAGTIEPALSTICNGTSPIINKKDAPTGGTTPYTFTWEYSTDGGTQWNLINGFTGEGPLNIAPAITGPAQYRRTVNSTVCKATTSTVSVAVTGQMLPGAIHGTTLTICQGKIAGPLLNDGLASGGTGNAITYQWQSSTDGTAWSDLPTGATDSSYTPTVGLTQDTYFRRRATNGTGQCDTVFAGPVKIVQYKTLNPGTIESKDTSVCIGSDITVHSIALPSDGSPTKTYTWVVSYPPSTTQKDTAINSPEITIPNLQRDMIFKRVVKDECISGDTSTNVFSVKIIKKTIPDLTFITDLSKTYCTSSDLTVMLSTKNAGKNRAIDWTYNGATSRSQPDSVFTVRAADLVNGASIQATVTSDPTLFCTETRTSTTAIPVKIDTKVSSNTFSSGDESKCSTSPLDSIYAAPALGTLGSPAYEWQISSDKQTWQNLSVATQNYFPATILGDRYYRRIAFSAGTCRNDTMTTSVKVFVDTPINPGQILAVSTCSQDSIGGQSVINATGGTGTIHYAWKYSLDGQTGWAAVGKDSAGLFIRDKVVLDNSGTVIQFYFERVATSDGGQCSAISAVVGVKVCQKPIIKSPIYVTECEGVPILGHNILASGDYSPNGGNLIVDPIPVQPPVNGSFTIDSRSKTFSYTPTSPTFIGKDSAKVSICDSITQRCTTKTIYIKYLPVNHPPVIKNELLETYRNQVIDWHNILANDSDPDGDTLYVLPNWKKTMDSIVMAPKHGRMAITNSGELAYEPERDLGTYETVYDTAIFVICEYNSSVDYCNDFFCQKDTVVFEIKPYHIHVPGGFSPNEDGVNDYFVIRSEVQLDIELKVYNRWGNLVYENKHYKNDWNGNANRGIVIGEGVPDGTYYIHYDVHDKIQEPGFKYITINR